MSDIKPTAWRSHDCARAITNRELANVPDENGRRDRCASLYPVPLYEKGALAEARRQAFIEAAEIAENPFAHATKQFPDADEIAVDIASAIRTKAEEISNA